MGCCKFEKLNEDNEINRPDVGKHAELDQLFNSFPSLFSDSLRFRFNTRSSSTEMSGVLSLSDTVFYCISEEEEEEEEVGVRSPLHAGQWHCRAVCTQLGLPLPPSEEV